MVDCPRFVCRYVDTCIMHVDCDGVHMKCKHEKCQVCMFSKRCIDILMRLRKVRRK